MRVNSVGAGWVFLGAFALSAASTSARDLTFNDRVRAQEAIERVYYSHQIDATLPFEGAVPPAVLEKKVRTYLRQTVALERFWKTPVTSEMLRKESERMARQTRMPARLRELFAALGNDPFLIRECLARPALVDRLVRSFFAADQRISAGARGEGRKLGEGLRIASAPVRRKMLEEWWEDVEAGLDEASVRAVASPDGSSPASDAISQKTAGGCLFNDSWDNRSFGDPPSARYSHTAVWTGSLMLVWGGLGYEPRIFNTGGRYDPAIDIWTQISTSAAPSARHSHVAVWTGSRMVVWGGRDLNGNHFSTGGRYDPSTNTWGPTSTDSTPPAGTGYVAVWAGGRMVVWNPGSDSGGRYDPASDGWDTLSPSSTLANRIGVSVLSTGSLMIAWGGRTSNLYHDTGARYDPVTDSWAPLPTSGAPSAREWHTAVWTGSQMVVWGGSSSTQFALASGAGYDPAVNSWSPISSTDAPALTRHTAAWAGGRMVVWRDNDNSNQLPSIGGRYDPANDTWAPMSTLNAPVDHAAFQTISTGSQMIVWGGHYNGTAVDSIYFDTGGRYDPAADTWTPTFSQTAPSGRVGHTGVWTGSRMVIWGGFDNSYTNTGGRYDPATDTWSPTATSGAPEGRYQHTALWTGSRMVVWGGFYFDGATQTYSFLDSGGRYDPIADSWLDNSTAGAPSGRYLHSALWTGSEMIVWGGYDGTSAVGTGARYDPANDSWLEISPAGAPSARSSHSAIWTGSRMVIWGGADGASVFGTGSRYDPANDNWFEVSPAGAPSARSSHSAIWTGSRMVIWGGRNGATRFNTGGLYDPVGDGWTPTSTTNAPSPRSSQAAVWTGNEMVVWGGYDGSAPLGTGGRYEPAGNAWEPTSSSNAPRRRYATTGVWTGDLLLIWGGVDEVTGITISFDEYLATGGQYCLCATASFYPDSDGDGFGDPASPLSACSAPSGHVANGGDCNDADAAHWATPGEALNLVFTDAVTLGWSPPVQPGATAIAYDAIRSENPANFLSAGACVAADVSGTGATDPDTSPLGATFHYLVRAQNGCPNGQGPLGNASDGTPRAALNCP